MNRKYLFVVLGLMMISLVATACSTQEARYAAPRDINAVSEIGEGNSCSACCPDSGGVVNCCSANCQQGQTPLCNNDGCNWDGYPDCSCV